ncbi:MAG: metallophosphoesterase [Erysipelotrichaceae bacterium]|nr:metallophosphoesterase [Erysipelotrichaceae bacterium]
MKIVVCSDNHGNFDVINKILNLHPDADYYWHLGDSEAQNINQLKPFISVKGNNDFFIDLPLYRIIEINKYRFLLIHGTGLTYFGYDNLVYKGLENNCNIILFGHTHTPLNEYIKERDVYLINPGSCHHNRNIKYPTYCIIYIDNDSLLNVKFYEIND